MSATLTPLPEQSGNLSQGAPESSPSGELVCPELGEEVKAFAVECEKRYLFNSRWDNALNISGILLSVGIVASGVYQRGAVAAILGAFVAAIVSAQKAFPFGQRASFYRILVGQSANLQTDIEQNLVRKPGAVAILKSLRLDFAQQLPRGSTFNSADVSQSASGVSPQGGPQAGDAKASAVPGS